MEQTLSVVIPTYNRGSQLVRVVDHILESKFRTASFVEIIVIDNSSEIPAERFIDRLKVVEPFSLEVIRQPNKGPAAARNAGLGRARGDIIIFIDDDVLIEKNTLEQHCAAHRQYPGAVIFGGYPYTVPERETPEYRFLKKLIDEGVRSLRERAPGKDFVRVNAVASGNLSIEKKYFPELYDSSLKTPGAEEYELNYTLFRKNVPIYTGFGLLNAWHLQPPTIEDKCIQEFKYGVGVAEVCIKKPEVLEFAPIRGLFNATRQIKSADPAGLKFKKFVKVILSVRVIRTPLLNMVSLLGKIFSSDRLLFPLYRLVAGIYLFAGVRNGIRRFKKVPGETLQ